MRDVPGVRSFTASSITGSVLVDYEPRLGVASVLETIRERLQAARSSLLFSPKHKREAWTPLPGENPFISYLKHTPEHAGLVQAAVVTAFVDRFFEAAPPVMIGAGVDIVSRGRNSFIGKLGFDSFSSQLGFLGVASAVVWLLDSLFGYLHTITSERLALAVQNDLRNEVYRHLQQLDLAALERRPVSDWMAILDGDIGRIGKFIALGVDPIITIAANSIIVLTTFLTFSPALALIHVALGPAIYFISRGMLSRIMERYEAMRESEGRLSAMLHGNVAGMATIASFTRQDYEAERVAQAGEEWALSMNRVSNLSAFYTPSIQIAAGAGFLSTLIWGAILVNRGQLNPGAYNTMGSASLRVLAALGRLGMTAEQFQRANVSMMRVIKTLQRRPAVAGGPDPFSEEAARGDIVFDDVRFAYNPETPVLRGISLVIPGAKTTGLVGPTGAGKTTILKLLLRFYDANSGSIRVGGKDIKDLELDALRTQIALVPQNTFLFGGAVRDNIAYANPAASDDEVRQAARVAGADAFIEELPKGYDTPMSERALQLSGGQQQRIAIARAVLSKRSILLFDEATSAIDFETEAAIQKSLQEAAKDRTIVLIAHRLSTVRNADLIYVMDNGCVLEKGRHEDLIQANGLYATLWRIQTGELAQRPDAPPESQPQKAEEPAKAPLAETSTAETSPMDASPAPPTRKSAARKKRSGPVGSRKRDSGAK